MKLLKNSFSFFAIFILSIGLSFAQDFKKDYDEVKEAYTKLDKFFCELKINIFDNQKSTIPSQVMSSTIKKHANDYWYSMGNIKMVINNNCILYINEDLKEMIYTIRDVKKEVSVPNQNAASVIDTIIQKYDSVVYRGVVENCKKYIIYSNKTMISQADLFIDKESHLIKKIVYYYNAESDASSNKVIIDYSKIDLFPVFKEDEFSEKKYAVYSKNILKPVGRYVGYQTSVIDQKDFK